MTPLLWQQHRKQVPHAHARQLLGKNTPNHYSPFASEFLIVERRAERTDHDEINLIQETGTPDQVFFFIISSTSPTCSWLSGMLDRTAVCHKTAFQFFETDFRSHQSSWLARPGDRISFTSALGGGSKLIAETCT
jgi:hypothetical protein